LTASGTDAKAETVISGLSDDSTHIALIDAHGRVIAASPHFSALDISSATLEDLIIEAGDAPDRIVKRRIRAGQHSAPGAVARLTDPPPMHLLCIVGDAPAAAQPAPDALPGKAEEILEEMLPEPAEPATAEAVVEEVSTEQLKPTGF